ncbi:type 1 glutamine amidotransferase domain-containing protein [Qipengyuania sp. 6B39]|uniref:type 1 glutamine amidotransferase domain-containing protein n=1 Tax=Qipengyuania proteolytica TaxID=2867239 RepID=UPI001C89AD03|nr:type 1 glutamine amidotransferase domain-containing protein [Qipengyuania proteolytica]MBX7494358.1 type 1 glutamine amidotransferase domain-containing protein [Qipengyuania proteolytica]
MLRKISLALASAGLLLAPAAMAAATPPAPAEAVAALPQRVLLVVSSHGRGTGGEAGQSQPGFEMDELAQAWLILKANGLAVDIASPAGGPVEADGFDPAKAYNAAFLADAEASAKLAQTLRLDPGMAEAYGAIMVIGGKGAMFDLPFSQVLHGLLATLENRGGVIAAVCHGPAVFARMLREDGTPWAAGRQLAGFTDEEEALFGKRWVKQFPFLLESELRASGARFGEAPMMLPHVEIDDRLVTGQNPFSVGRASEAVVRVMGKAPVSREPWADERSVMLVARALEGDEGPLVAALADKGADIDVPLVAIWGYYRALEAGENRAMLAPALRIMELALPHFPEPQLQAAIADARARLVANGQ